MTGCKANIRYHLNMNEQNCSHRFQQCEVTESSQNSNVLIPYLSLLEKKNERAWLPVNLKYTLLIF